MRAAKTILLVLACLLSLAGGGSRCHASDTSKADIRDLRRQLLDLRFKVLTQEGECEALRQENKLIANPFSALDDARNERTVSPELHGTWDRIFQILKSSSDQRLAALDKLLSQVAQERDDAAAHWRWVSEQSLAIVDDIAAADERFGSAVEMPAVIQPLGRIEVALLLLGLPVILVGWAVALHEARHGIRRWVRSGSRLWPLLVSLIGIGTAGCARIGGSSEATIVNASLKQQAELLTAEAKELQEKSRHLNDKLAKAHVDVERNRHRLIEARIDDVAAAGPRRRIADDLGALESATQVRIGRILADSFVIKGVAKQGLEEVAELEWRQKQLDERLAQGRSGSVGRGAMTLGLCVAVVALAFAPLVAVRRRNRKQQLVDTATCPRCLSGHSLKLLTGNARDARQFEPRHMECRQCKYHFREMYRHVQRECFGVVGIRGSGKTHWLVTAYEQIKNGHVSARAALQKVPSLADEQFERYIKEVLEAHQQMHPTGPGVPSPLMFSVRDVDRWGRAGAMMNVFDFAGAVTSQDIYASDVRRRALLMDGIILFLDPTQLRPHDVDLGIDSQILALTQLHEELRDLRRMRMGRVIPVPVAVCVSKLDLLLNRNPLGSRSRALIKGLRGTLSEKPSLSALHARSRLLSREMQLIFPGWNLQRTLRENFGSRWLFFPLTPVGIEEDELGVEDLKRRTFAPFGIVEPLLWLLHMRGYCVF